MRDSYNSSISSELASLRALAAMRRRVSARDRLTRERRQSAALREYSRGEAAPMEDWGADD
jgi:hypothetical protein